MKRGSIRLALIAAVALGLAGAVVAQTAALTPREELGKKIYFDSTLSDPPGQACAACHAPEVGFTGPNSDVNAVGAVYPGAIPTRFGNRKPPAASYAYGPNLAYDAEEGLWLGGTFWDGRATGAILGDPLAEQAMGPFLNPVEQNMANAQAVCLAIQSGPYVSLFEQVWGPGSLDCSVDITGTYRKIAFSISAFERSAEVNPFSSKFDLYLEGAAKLSGIEKKGLLLFEGKGKCSQCHVSELGADGGHPMFTDFSYDNLGVPKNPDNPFYDMPAWINPDGAAWIDFGLGGYLAGAGYAPTIYEPELGKQKVPTLRNVARIPYNGFVKAYGHNGHFKSLQSIVHFYNTRDVLPLCESIDNPKEGLNCWPAAEVSMNMNTDELGNLGLKPQEEEALVEFLKTLTDGYRP